jgi:hypothetical protein
VEAGAGAMSVLSSDLTYQFKDAGVLLNQDTPSFPFFDVEKIVGLDSAQGRLTLRDQEGMDGGNVDAEFETTRTIVISGTAYGTTDTIELYLDNLKENFGLDNTTYPFYFKHPGVTERVLFCKPGGMRYDIDMARRSGYTVCDITLYAEDPVIYENNLRTYNLTLPAASATGRGYNKSYNFGYGGLSASGIYNIYNYGNRPAPGTITLPGPVINPRIVHLGKALELKFNTEILAGDYYVIDLRRHTVLLNGTANRRSTLEAPNWFLFDKGNNDVQYTAGTSTASVATIALRSAYR